MAKNQVCLAIIVILFAAVFIVVGATPVSAAKIHGDVYDLSLDRISNVVIEVNTTPNQRVISKNGSYSFTLPIGSYKITAAQYQNNATIAKAEEIVQAIDEGDYVLDLFLYPNLDEEQSILNSTDVTQIPDDSGNSMPIMILAAVIIVALAGIVIVMRAKSARKKGESPRADKAPKSENDKEDDNTAQMPEAAEKSPVKEEVKTDVNAGTQIGENSGTNAKPLEPAELDDDLKKVLEILKAEGGRTTQKEIRKHIPLSEAKVSLIITEMEVKGLVEKIKKGRGNIIILKKHK